MLIIREYEQEDGEAPFKKWFDSLGPSAALKIRTATAQMEAGNFGDHKPVGEGVWEGDELVLLFWGGTKTRQQSDIEKAKSLYSEYKFRKKEHVKKQEQRNQETKSKQTHSPPRRKK
jgi:putative component of toxin-antitoxin plasmid stabilization module